MWSFLTWQWTSASKRCSFGRPLKAISCSRMLLWPLLCHLAYLVWTVNLKCVVKYLFWLIRYLAQELHLTWQIDYLSTVASPPYPSTYSFVSSRPMLQALVERSKVICVYTFWVLSLVWVSLFWCWSQSSDLGVESWWFVVFEILNVFVRV